MEGKGSRMYARFKIVGIGLVIAGIVFVGVGGYTYMKTQAGRERARGLQRGAERQARYNDQGQLTDRGTAEGAAPILALLKDDWGYTVDPSELNPNDPVVNTASEYMVQMATIAHHTLDGTQTVVLPEDVTADDGTVYKAGSYDVPVAGRYWSAFDRTNPIDAKVREQAWTGTAHALIAELGVGSVTASPSRSASGSPPSPPPSVRPSSSRALGIVWAARPVTEKATEKATKPVTVPGRDLTTNHGEGLPLRPQPPDTPGPPGPGVSACPAQSPDVPSEPPRVAATPRIAPTAGCLPTIGSYTSFLRIVPVAYG